MPNPLQERRSCQIHSKKIGEMSLFGQSSHGLAKFPQMYQGWEAGNYIDLNIQASRTQWPCHKTVDGLGSAVILRSWRIELLTPNSIASMCLQYNVFHWCRWPLTQTSDAPSGRAICFHQRARWKLEIMQIPSKKIGEMSLFGQSSHGLAMFPHALPGCWLMKQPQNQKQRNKHCGIHAVCHSSHSEKTLRGNRPCR